LAHDRVEAESWLGGLDAVIVSAGLFDSQEALESDPGRCRAWSGTPRPAGKG
jgi:hypothetical protein